MRPPARGTLVPLILTVLLAGACRHESPAGPFQVQGHWSASGVWAGRVVLTDDVDHAHWPSDAVDIVDVSVVGDSLSVSVRYGGGCANHAFVLLAGTAWMESYPVQLRLRVAHDAKGDPCDALFTRELRFDLTPIRAAYRKSYQANTGAVVLHLLAAPSSPIYAF